MSRPPQSPDGATAATADALGAVEAPAARVDGRTTRWAGHREQRRGEFVEAAIAAIERHGPGATVDQISAELGVTRQALYRQFPDRAALDRAVAERAATELVEQLMPHLDLDGDIERSIRAALAAYLDYVQAHLSLYRFVRAHDAEIDTPDGDSAVRRVKHSVTNRIAGIAREYLLSTGAAGSAHAATLATGLVGMADAVIGGWLDDPGELSRDELVDALVRMLGGAVRATL